MSNEISFYRGDSYPIVFNVKEAGVAIDVSTMDFIMTVSIKKDPTVAEDILFTLTGTTSVTLGEVIFLPTTDNTDLTPAKYFYDVQMTNSSNHVRTIEKTTFIITQDISK